jgi:hypothetical protein
MAHFLVIDLTTRTRTVGTLDEVAAIAQLDPADVEWALEEEGVCETDTYVIADYTVGDFRQAQ